MQRLTPCGPRFRPEHTVQAQRTVCVVDPQPEDYSTWQATADEHGLQLKFLASAQEALRLARAGQVDMWVVSTALPGLSGFDLCGMLRRQSPQAPVFMVATEYTVEAEQAAWRARASMFGCKPEQAHWLDEWLPTHRHSSPQRSVTAPREVPSRR